jgi:hypothetical protein
MQICRQEKDGVLNLASVRQFRHKTGDSRQCDFFFKNRKLQDICNVNIDQFAACLQHCSASPEMATWPSIAGIL